MYYHVTLRYKEEIGVCNCLEYVCVCVGGGGGGEGLESGIVFLKSSKKQSEYASEVLLRRRLRNKHFLAY